MKRYGSLKIEIQGCEVGAGGVKLSWSDKLLNVQNGLQALDLENFKCDLDELDWSPIVGLKLVDLINSYFVAILKRKEDLEFILTGGPRLISGQYLVVHK